MKKKLILVASFILLLTTSFYITSKYSSEADARQECDVFIITETGDHKRGVLDCNKYKPMIVSSGTTIAPGGSIELWVDSGGLAVPPYTWSVSGLGYSIDSQSNSDLETVTLTSAAGSCGSGYSAVALITVKDKCGETYDIVVFNSSGSYRIVETKSYDPYTTDGFCSTGCCPKNPDKYIYEGDHYWLIRRLDWNYCLQGDPDIIDWYPGNYPPNCSPVTCSANYPNTYTGNCPKGTRGYCGYRDYIYYVWKC